MFINQTLLSRIAEPNLLLVHPHAQRTGGKTFRNRFLARILGSGKIYGRSFVPNSKGWQLLTDSDLEGYKAYSDLFDYTDIALSRPCLGLAIMRDPTERALSVYGFVRGKPSHGDHRAAMTLDIEEFYRRIAPRSPAYYINVQCRRLCGYPDSHLALRAIHAKFLGVGFTNEIEAFTETLCGLFGWKTPALTRSEGNKYDEATPSFRNLIRRQNAEDVALFEAMTAGPPYRIAPRPFGFEARRMATTAAYRMRSWIRPLKVLGRK